MAETEASPEKRLRSVVGTLKRKYGSDLFPERKDPMEALLFYRMACVNPITAAKRALRALREEYVDWNELRVSSLREIQETLESQGVELSAEMAEAVKKTLATVFEARNDLDLSTLLEDSEAARKFISELQLETWVKEYLSLLLEVSERVPPLDPSTERILERVGVFPFEAGSDERKKVLASLVRPQDARMFHYLMLEHGKKSCLPGDPRCDRCMVRSSCAFGTKKPKPLVAVARPATPPRIHRVAGPPSRAEGKMAPASQGAGAAGASEKPPARGGTPPPPASSARKAPPSGKGAPTPPAHAGPGPKGAPAKGPAAHRPAEPATRLAHGKPGAGALPPAAREKVAEAHNKNDGKGVDARRPAAAAPPSKRAPLPLPAKPGGPGRAGVPGKVPVRPAAGRVHPAADEPARAPSPGKGGKAPAAPAGRPTPTGPKKSPPPGRLLAKPPGGRSGSQSSAKVRSKGERKMSEMEPMAAPPQPVFVEEAYPPIPSGGPPEPPPAPPAAVPEPEKPAAVKAAPAPKAKAKKPAKAKARAKAKVAAKPKAKAKAKAKVARKAAKKPAKKVARKVAKKAAKKAARKPAKKAARKVAKKPAKKAARKAAGKGKKPARRR